MSIRSGRLRAWTIAFASLLPAVPVGAQQLVVDVDAERAVRFVSETTLEAFDGRTDAVDGYAWLGEGRSIADLRSGATFPDGTIYFEVDLASIDTGISLRNRHMREDYLETERFPWATFEGRIAAVSEHPEGGVRITSPGTFAVHGVERTRTIDCRVTGSAPRLRVRCAFDVTLADHDIEIPQVMFLKLAEEVRVELDFHLTPSGDLP